VASAARRRSRKRPAIRSLSSTRSPGPRATSSLLCVGLIGVARGNCRKPLPHLPSWGELMPPGSEPLGETVSDVAGLHADDCAGAVALDGHRTADGKVQRSSGTAALVPLNLIDDRRLAPGAGIAGPVARIFCVGRPRAVPGEEQKLFNVALVVDQAAVEAIPWRWFLSDSQTAAASRCC